MYVTESNGSNITYVDVRPPKMTGTLKLEYHLCGCYTESNGSNIAHM